MTLRALLLGLVVVVGAAARAHAQGEEPAPRMARLTIDGAEGLTAAASSADAPELRLCATPCDLDVTLTD